MGYFIHGIKISAEMNIYQNIINGMLFENIRVFNYIIIIPLCNYRYS